MLVSPIFRDQALDKRGIIPNSAGAQALFHGPKSINWSLMRTDLLLYSPACDCLELITTAAISRFTCCAVLYQYVLAIML